MLGTLVGSLLSYGQQDEISSCQHSPRLPRFLLGMEVSSEQAVARGRLIMGRLRDEKASLWVLKLDDDQAFFFRLKADNRPSCVIFKRLDPGYLPCLLRE